MTIDNFLILGIESSCDDTSAALLSEEGLLSNITSNQTVHAEYGGVVPELASREHIQHIVPVVETALKRAHKTHGDLTAVAVTRGPGLMGSLLVGVSYAKALAMALNIPLIEVNHMHAHILAHFIEEPVPSFPFLCLTVSGGHTQIVKVNSPDKMEILGTTLDDAAGEAFDKVGKMCGLPYPSGPIIDQYAREGQVKYTFPIASVPELNFSFSGLKTAVLRFLQKELKKNPSFIEENIKDIAASVQDNIVKTLTLNLRKASQKTGIKEIAIAGGVSANQGLRSKLEEIGIKESWNVYIPKLEYCTDNAAMIAQAAFFKFRKKEFASQTMVADPRLIF